MEIYKFEPPKVIRVSIIRNGCANERFILCDTDLDERERFMRNISTSLESNISVGKVSIMIREGHGAVNGKSKLITFKSSFTPEYIAFVIKTKLLK
jgi:hypothetical protein